MKICLHCVLPETFPGVSFDEAGVCAFCRQCRGGGESHAREQARTAAKFADLLAQVMRAEERQRRAYDALLAYSGGKDSTYTLWLLREKYGLRVLALSFDNGFISPRALENLRAVTATLDVDHLLFRPRWDLLKTVFAASAEHELYPRKALERASTICTSCIGLVKSICLKTAIEQRIPLLGYGWSPGQAPLRSSIMRTNPVLTRATQNSILKPMREAAGPEVEGWFLREEHFSDPSRFPTIVHPLAWEQYDEVMIRRHIERLGWCAPQDTDSNSTNCLLNAYANEVHLKRYGFHPYVWEIAKLVRDGVMSRAAGMVSIYGPTSPESAQEARRKLGIDAKLPPEAGGRS